MALVAYDNSDSSEFEDEDRENLPAAEFIHEPEKPVIPINEPQTPKTEESTSETSPTLFNLLPQPTNTKKQAVIEEDDEFLHKKADVKPKAKITVPSLSDFKDVESTVVAMKPKPAVTKKSSLLSMLPQPKNGLFKGSTKALVPNVLRQKPNNVKKKTTLTNTLATESDESDDDVQNDFFSFNKTVDLPEPIDLPIEMPKVKPEEPKISKLESYFKKDVVETPVQSQPDEISYSEFAESEASSSYSNGVEAESAKDTEMVLDDEAIIKLCGSRGKRRREDIQIVDVDQTEVLAEARQWLLKGLMDDTSKRISSSKKRGNEPTNMQKRKHQITYLAHQAKANEAELQNQWANNRMTRRKTQSKYGF